MHYYGVTNNPKNRWKSNGCQYKTTALQPYIEKFGWDNIQHIVLYENLTYEDALKIEDSLIISGWEKGNCINKRRSGNVSNEEGYYQQYCEENKDQINEQKRKYYERNKDQIREKQKQNKDRIREYQKQYREQNKDQIREKQKQYYEENKQQYKEYQEQNKDRIREYQKQYQEQNKDKIREYQKQYREQNKDKKREYNRQYRQRKKQEKQLKEVETTLF